MKRRDTIKGGLSMARPVSPNTLMILKLLKDYGPLTFKELRELTKLSRIYLEARLIDLMKVKRVKRESKNPYFYLITREGIQWLTEFELKQVIKQHLEVIRNE